MKKHMLYSGGAVAAYTTVGLRKGLDFLEVGGFGFDNNHLSHALTFADDEPPLFVAVDYHAYALTKIRVNHP